MYGSLQMRQYQQQSVLTSSPEQLVLKIYDLGIAACRRNDRTKVRAVLAELMGSLNFEEGGDVASQLQGLYEYCLIESANGDLDTVRTLLEGLREAWREGVMARKAA